MTAIPDDVVLIGVDGGASKVRACRVDRSESGLFCLTGKPETRVYPLVPGFVPVSPATQEEQQRHKSILLADTERTQGAGHIDAAVDAVVQVAAAGSTQAVLIGLCMPGLKSADGRSIERMNNGPRIPDYLDQFEHGLLQRGLTLANPIRQLASDADCCGLGEEFGDGGRFSGVQNGYYLGSGSGVAEALKLDGELVPFDDVRSWLPKAWQLQSRSGLTFEELISAGAVNARWKKQSNADGTGSPEFVETAAAAGDVHASAILNDAATAVAELIFRRMRALLHSSGSFRAMPAVGAGQRGLKSAPAALGRVTALDRVVLGQRLGVWFDDSRLTECFRKPLCRSLAVLICDSGEAVLRRQCLSNDQVTPSLLQPSALQEAPLVGAAVAALGERGFRLWATPDNPRHKMGLRD